MDQLSPEGLAAVIKDLVTSGLWLNKQSVGYGQTQLQNLVLGLTYIQSLEEDHAFAMMHTLAELGYSITQVISRVERALDISSARVAKLLKLAVVTGEVVDMCHLAKCTNAPELEADCVPGWPGMLLFCS
jgi:hypothetical protein